ncbi:hypothetical protein CEE37_10775 [candidate division LCP-89 bacterium B3_LCP]|uniref:histidine kinase n=1 Tax=candidate division LCP-89 bacterium B3_LCP TaxID=2012998 RepID=A0A532UXT2_UNCL8|nr:MAG: hypothetical protein CEE37_10775 [candidate division LCP-89 bacterium B3_LCP]
MDYREDMQPDRIMLENSLAFFGAVTASISHELNNVIAIIDQNIGLLADLLITASAERPIPNERLQRISDSVQAQTDRGVRIIKGLNTFAHSVDDPIREFDLNQLINNFTSIAQRLASLRKVNLESDSEAQELMVTSSPFIIQQVLFYCIQRALNRAQPGDVIKIDVHGSDTQVDITLTGRVDQVDNGWNEQYIQQLMQIIFGSVEVEARDPEELIHIKFSRKAGI